jgi:hypothetical protein
MTKQNSTPLAALVVGLIAAGGCMDDDGKDKDVGEASAGLKCEGGNECAGMSECASGSKNDCQGMNECKGMGWLTVDTEEECKKLGGTISKAAS